MAMIQIDLRAKDLWWQAEAMILEIEVEDIKRIIDNVVRAELAKETELYLGPGSLVIDVRKYR